MLNPQSVIVVPFLIKSSNIKHRDATYNTKVVRTAQVSDLQVKKALITAAVTVWRYADIPPEVFGNILAKELLNARPIYCKNMFIYFNESCLYCMIFRRKMQEAKESKTGTVPMFYHP